MLDTELNEIAGDLNTQHARLVDATVQLLAHPERWKGDGVRKPAQYLCWRVGVSPHRAAQVVTIAERVDELPECVEAFRRGELTPDAMAAIAKRAPWWTDRTARNYGISMTVTQLRRVLARYPFPDIPGSDSTDDAADSTGSASDGTDTAAGSDGTAADSDDTADQDSAGEGTDSGGAGKGSVGDVEPDDVCNFGFDETGRRFRLDLETDAATGRVINTALIEARDAAFQDGNTTIDWADVIREICERSLDTIDEPGRRDRYRINIHIDATTTGGANAVDGLGWRIPDAIRRYITCDGLLSPVFTSNGIPISVGRTQRIGPDRTRRQVVLRDQGCRIPGCNATLFLEVHHIIHWEDDGPTDTWNLICLCPHHHRLHHHGKLGITGNADLPGGVTFTNAAGNPIAQTGTSPTLPDTPPSAPVGTYRHPVGERLDTTAIYFNPPLRTPRGGDPAARHGGRAGPGEPARDTGHGRSTRQARHVGPTGHE